jgi:hypothetical protein
MSSSSKLWRAALVFVALTASLISACTTEPPAPTPPTAAVGDAAVELESLLEAIRTHHPDPWHGVDEETFTSELTELAQRAPSLDADARLVELMRLVALLGRAGREGHTGIIPWTTDTPGTHVYPIQLWQFPDGLYVVAAMAPHEGLVGARVTHLGGHPIADISAAVRPLVPHENDQSYLSFGPMFHLVPEVLHGLGLLPEAGAAEITAVAPSGAGVSAMLEPIEAEQYRAWLSRSAIMPPPAGSPPPAYMLGAGEPLTVLWLAESGTIYLRYREVRTPDSAAITRVKSYLAAGGVNRVVVDLRWNPGGNNRTYPPLLSALLDPAVDRPGRLYVLTSRVTFSAATNFATELDQRSSAIFVGEPTGGSPNLYGDVTMHRMAWFGATVRIPTIYWEKSTPDDPRLAIEPDLVVPLTAADYFAGRDPVLAAVLAR